MPLFSKRLWAPWRIKLYCFSLSSQCAQTRCLADGWRDGCVGRGTVRNTPNKRTLASSVLQTCQRHRPNHSCHEDVLLSHIAWTIIKNKLYFKESLIYIQKQFLNTNPWRKPQGNSSKSWKTCLWSRTTFKFQIKQAVLPPPFLYVTNKCSSAVV